MEQENIVKTALEAGRKQALAAQPSLLSDGKPYIVLRDKDGSEQVVYVDGRFEAPARATGKIKISDTASFVRAWDFFNDPESKVYGSITPAQFVAVFNDHDEKPGFRDHRAIYTLANSPEWLEWIAKSGKRFESTTEFAEWLEDRIPDFVEPAGAKMLEIVLNLRVQQNVVYSKVQRLSDGHCEFTYKNVVEGNTVSGDAAGQIRIPETFAIEIPVFAGLDAKKYRVEARFRYRLQGQLQLWFEIVRPHKVIEAAFKDALAEIESKCKTQVIFGSPE